MHDPSPPRRGRARLRFVRHSFPAVCLLFVALTVVQTWPLASAPGYWSRTDSGDYSLNAWTVTWVAHALGSRPRRLYDANIFHPERRTLAFSEHLLVQGVIAAPVVWLGGSPILAYNVALLAGFALTGLAFCLLAHRWTGSWTAGCVAGSLAAFNSHSLTRLPHLQTLHVEFFALALYGLDRLLGEARARHAVTGGLGHALQGLASVYLLVFTSWALVFASLARLPEWLGRGRRRAAAMLVLMVLVAAVSLAPFLSVYYVVNREHGFARSVVDARRYAGRWTDYLYTGSRLHYQWWSRRFGGHSANFPGVVAIGLSAVTLATGFAWRDPRARMALFVTTGCILLAMVPRLPGYEWLHAAVPLLQVVRVMAHFGQVALIGVALLAGFGVAWLQRRWGGKRWWTAAAVALVLLVNAEASRAPYWFEPFTGIPAAYDVLRNDRRAIVVDLPLFHRHAIFHNTIAMLGSTRHWHPILNGYSGFIPDSYHVAYETLTRFPEEDSLAFLRGLGVTHVVVQEDLFTRTYGRPRYEAIRVTPALEEIAASGTVRVYRLRRR